MGCEAGIVLGWTAAELIGHPVIGQFMSVTQSPGGPCPVPPDTAGLLACQPRQRGRWHLAFCQNCHARI